MVTEGDRLGHLHMGKTWQNRVGLLQCNSGKRPTQGVQEVAELIDFIAQPQADIGCDLIVA